MPTTVSRRSAGSPSMADSEAETSDNAAVDAFMTEWNAFMVQAEPQLFMQIINLAGAGARPQIWLRYVGMDFMADCRVLRPGSKRRMRIKAIGPTIEECLNNLASSVAGYLYPPGEAP